MSAGVRLVVDDAGDGTGMLAVAASTATPADIATLVRHGSGFLFVTVSAATAARLDLPAMRGAAAPDADARAADRQRVSVDAAAGISTGISALDRSRTARLLADPTTTAADLRRPGHVVPVVVDTGHPLLAADRVHRALGVSVVYAHVPGGSAGTGLAGTDELVGLAAALTVPLLRTRPQVEEPDEFLGQLHASLIVVR